ncbi:MAG: M48 family metallopeptidase [Acidobacteriota bacterium]
MNSISPEDFARLAAEAARHPAGYRRKVVALAALGYGYVLTIGLGALALAVGLLVGMIRVHFNAGLIKLEILLLAFAAMVLRSLWVRIEPPQGLPLDRARVPELFSGLDALRKKLRTPDIHRVLLVPDFNAAIAQVPRLGLLGWQRNHLILGLPLLYALSPDEIRAVLAHELGHLSRAHGRTGTWLYRARTTWDQLGEQLAKSNSKSTFLFRSFFAWFLPRFSSRAFVLSRQQEYEADRHAAEIAGAEALGDALVRLRLGDAALGRELLPAFWRQAEHLPEPPRHGLIDLWRTTGREAVSGEAATRLDEALAEATGLEDTHPSLAQRLSALHVAPRVPGVPEVNAAEHYLGAALPGLAEELESTLLAAGSPAWRERHGEATRERAELVELAGRGDPTPEQTLRRAELTESLDGEAAALPLYQAALALSDQLAGAHFALGRILAGRGDKVAQAHLEKAISLDRKYEIAGLAFLSLLFQSKGDAKGAALAGLQLSEQVERLTEAERRRNRIAPGDSFRPNGLDAAAVEALRVALAQFPELKTAYLVRKVDNDLPDRPLLILGIRLSVNLKSRAYYTQYAQRIINALGELLPGEAFVMALDLETRALRAALRDASGAEVYRRG